MASSFRIETNLKQVGQEFDLLAKRFPKQFDVAVKNGANLVIADLKRNTPKQSGNTSKGYVTQRLALANYVITNTVRVKGSSLFVSDLLEKGTKDHGPKKAKALRFVDLGRRGNKALGIRGRRGTGKVVFTKFVKGIKALKIFEKSSKKALLIVRSTVVNKLRLITAKFNK